MPKLTPKQIEEMAKKMAASMEAEIKEAKEDNAIDDPLLNEKLFKMAEEQIKLANDAQGGRGTGEALNQDELDEAAAEAMFKDVNALGTEERFNQQEMKMITPAKNLGYIHGKDMAEQIEEFKRLNDDAYLVTSVMHDHMKRKKMPNNDFGSVYKNTNLYNRIHETLNGNPELKKALAVANTGQGAEWIPTGFSSQVLTTYELQLKVVALFNTISMPTNPYKLPVQISDSTGYYVPENTSDEGTKIPASTPGTSSPSFNARKLAARVVFSEEITEDSIISVRDFTINEITKAIARAHETCHINGDRTGAAGVAADHQDNAGTALFTSNYDARLAYDGLRYFALNQTDTSTYDMGKDAPSDASMNGIQVLGDKYAVVPSDCVWLSSVGTYLRALKSLTNIVTMDKYGPSATILKGEIMRYNGIPWVVTEYLYHNLNASGVYDGTTTTYSMILLVNRPSFLNGTKGGITLGSVNDIETDQVKLVVKRRVDFVDPNDATATGYPQSVAGIQVL